MSDNKRTYRIDWEINGVEDKPHDLFVTAWTPRSARHLAKIAARMNAGGKSFRILDVYRITEAIQND